MGLLDIFKSIRYRLTDKYNPAEWRAYGSYNSKMFATDDLSLLNNGYESNVDVYAVIKKLVDITKATPLIVEQYTGGRWKELKDTPFHELMTAPNTGKGYSWDDIEEQLLTYLLCTGNAYIKGEIPVGYRYYGEVDILPSQFVEIESKEDFFNPDIRYKFTTGSSSKKYVYTPDELAHIKMFNPAYTTVNESLYGLSIIQVAAKAVQVGNDRWDADANLLQNRGAIGLITDKSNRPMTSSEAQKVQEAFEITTAGTSNFGKVRVTNKDLSYIPMAMSSADLQLIEKGVINLRAICNVFGVDSSLFNDPANQTYNNRLEAEKALYTNAIMPLSNKVCEAYTRYFVPNMFAGKQVRIVQDFSNVEALQQDFYTKSKSYVDLVNAGIMSANQASELLEVESPAKPNYTVEALRSVSPLIANQFVGQMTAAEVRSLLGLLPTDEPKIGDKAPAFNPNIVTENNKDDE